MRNPVKSEFYTFDTKSKGMEGSTLFWTLNVSGARQVVLFSNGANNCFVTNFPKDTVLDGAGDFKDGAQFMILPSSGVPNSPLVISSNDDYLNVGVGGSKGTEEIYVWVIR